MKNVMNRNGKWDVNQAYHTREISQSTLYMYLLYHHHNCSEVNSVDNHINDTWPSCFGNLCDLKGKNLNRQLIFLGFWRHHSVITFYIWDSWKWWIRLDNSVLFCWKMIVVSLQYCPFGQKEIKEARVPIAWKFILQFLMKKKLNLTKWNKQHNGFSKISYFGASFERIQTFER